MSNFKTIIKNYIKNVSNVNDKRIMIEAVNIIDAKNILSDNEINVLKEVFMALKEDYTLAITQDRDTFNFMLAITEQEIPIVENKHELNVLYNLLKKDVENREISKLEETILTFLDACEHIEEDEVLIINKIIQYLTNNWALSPLNKKEIKGKEIRFSYITPTYNKSLVKKN